MKTTCIEKSLNLISICKWLSNIQKLEVKKWVGEAERIIEFLQVLDNYFSYTCTDITISLNRFFF